MCLFISDKHFDSEYDRAPKPKTAGIFGKTVYKMLVLNSGNYMTPFLAEPVNFNSKGVAEMRSDFAFAESVDSERKLYVILTKGIHAFRNKKAGNNACKRWLAAKDHLTHLTVLLLKARIPRGAKYFEGVDKDIASDRLIITNKWVFKGHSETKGFFEK